MVRVLHVIGKMDRAGAETMIMNIYRKIDYTRVQFDFLVFSQESGDYDNEIRYMGGNIYQVMPFKGYNYIRICWELKKFMRKHKYEIVHAHIGSLAPICLKYAKKNGAYTIAHSHAPQSNCLSERLIYNLFAYPVRYIADYYMACSYPAGRGRFGEKIANSDRFEIINNGIDSKLYQYTVERHERLKEKFGLKGKKVFGHVGRFEDPKNQSFLVKVFKEIANKENTAFLMLVGGGSQEEEIKREVLQLGMQERVEFCGVRTDIPDILNVFDAFIFPSFYEGLGVAAIEAQAAGLPCFFSEGVIKDAMITKNTWRYPLELGEKEWANRILNALKGVVRYDTQSDIIKAGFDVANIAEEMQEFYLKHGKENKIE